MADENREAELFELLGRIDERTKQTADDVEHLMRIVALGNGSPSLVKQVADNTAEIRAIKVNKANRAKIVVAALAFLGGGWVVITQLLS